MKSWLVQHASSIKDGGKYLEKITYQKKNSFAKIKKHIEENNVEFFTLRELAEKIGCGTKEVWRCVSRMKLKKCGGGVWRVVR